MFRNLFTLLETSVLLTFFCCVETFAAPLDTTYWKTFYINTIGGVSIAADYTTEYQGSMLTNTVGIMPRNIKIGFSAAAPKIGRAVSGYFDYLPFRLFLKDGGKGDP